MTQEQLQSIRGDSENGIVAYTAFLLSFDIEKKALYCFVEGDDDLAFYGIRIQENAPSYAACEFTCSGKEAVIEVNRLISSKPEYRNTKFAFFVDKDFDPPMDNPGIYETPCHSIENLYTSKNTILKILRYCFGIMNESDDMKECLKIFDDLHKDFRERISLLNAWICCYTDKRHLNLINEPVQLRKKTEKLFDGVVSQDLCTIRIPDEITDFCKLGRFFDSHCYFTEEEFNEKLLQFSTLDPLFTCRGKFELDFLFNYFVRLREALSKKNNSMVSKKYVCRSAFIKSNMLLQFSAFAHTPLCLREYIRRVAA